MKNSGLALTKRQQQATVRKWAAWIREQRARAAKTKAS
jgi:hypothetical protein